MCNMYMQNIRSIKNKFTEIQNGPPKSIASDMEVDISLLCLRKYTGRLYEKVMELLKIKTTEPEPTTDMCNKIKKRHYYQTHGQIR